MNLSKIIVLTLGLTYSLLARDAIDMKGPCMINWTDGLIGCEGESAAGQDSFSAKRVAVVEAQRNLLEVVKGVRIDSQTTVRDGIAGNDVIISRVDGVIRGAQVISNTYNEKRGSATARVQLRMGGDLLKALLSDPTKLSWNEKVEELWNSFSIITPAMASSSYSYKEKVTLEKLLGDMKVSKNRAAVKEIETILSGMDTNFTGMLIDVSDVNGFEKALIVRLVDKNGQELYPAGKLSKKMLQKRATSVGYVFGHGDAIRNIRVFNKPLEIKASKVYRRKRSNIVLSDAQVAEFQKLDPEIFTKAKIVLLLGE
ncbi:MAG: hypothetical protein WBF77_03390 [Sulfurimonadaceae bacterium]